MLHWLYRYREERAKHSMSGTSHDLLGGITAAPVFGRSLAETDDAHAMDDVTTLLAGQHLLTPTMHTKLKFLSGSNFLIMFILNWQRLTGTLCLNKICSGLFGTIPSETNKREEKTSASTVSLMVGSCTSVLVSLKWLLCSITSVHHLNHSVEPVIKILIQQNQL
jgi:hypothetical protein